MFSPRLRNEDGAFQRLVGDEPSVQRAFVLMRLYASEDERISQIMVDAATSTTAAIAEACQSDSKHHQVEFRRWGTHAESSARKFENLVEASQHRIAGVAEPHPEVHNNILKRLDQVLEKLALVDAEVKTN